MQLTTHTNRLSLWPALSGMLFVCLLATPAANAQEEVYQSALAKDISNFNDSVPVFKCFFGDEEWDVNYDQWPDGWTRSEDVDHASYTRIAIESGEEGIEGKQLVIHPDGSSVRIASPPIRVLPKFSYIIRLKLKEKGIRHGEIRVSLEYYNEENETSAARGRATHQDERGMDSN